MSQAPVRRDVQPSALDILREQIAPTATDGELAYLIEVSNRLELDPIAGQIVLIPRWDGRLQRNVSRPQITAEGRLVLAERTGDLVGIVGPEWCGPRESDGTHRWVDVWDDDEPPHAARVFVYRRGWDEPANGTVRWAEFAQYDRHDKLLPTWRQMPSHMLGKTAMSLGLRRAFPGVVPGDVDFADVTFAGTAGAALEAAGGTEVVDERRPPVDADVPPATDTQMRAIRNLCGRRGLDVPDDLSADDAARLIRELQEA
jgi:hypothetical protein